MNDKLDLALVGTLLKKQFQERAAAFKKGYFDAIGFLLQVLLVAAIIAIFVTFFGQFTDIYLAIRTNGVSNPDARLFELLSISYTIILLFLIFSAISKINRALFTADDLKLFTAMPVGAKTLYVSRLITIYLSQLVLAFLIILPVNLTVAIHVAEEPMFYYMTFVMCILLPLMSIAIASILALPYHALLRFLKPKFVLTFVCVTALTAVLVIGYAVILNAIKEMLFGDDLKYFFNERVMAGIALVAKNLYPGVWLANFMTGQDQLYSGLGVLLILFMCLLLSMVILRKIMEAVLQSRISGTPNFVFAERDISPRRKPFAALLRKEFLQIFRTPSYMFSYFSVAVVMPLMVYFCMSIGASLVEKLIGVNCNVEIAIFLTLLFGALTNVFCSTNVSRDGEVFYSVKAMPVDHKTVFFSKIIFCLIVTVATQLISAMVLLFTGYIAWYVALFVFFGGVLLSFSQICIATRYDFDHAKFSSEEDGEIKESGNTVSTVIVLGMLGAFLTGGSVLIVRMLTSLRGISVGYLTYLIVTIIAVAASVLSYLYFATRLGKKYYEFSGGGLM